MTIPKIPMSCDRFADVLADYLERDVDEATRAAMESHAQTCDDCGALLADLRALRDDAANLPELTPSRDLWQDIAARIETPVVALKNTTPVVERKVEPRRHVAWLGLAAAGLVAMTATITYQITARTVGSPTQIANTTATAPRAVTPDTVASPTQRVANVPDTASRVERSAPATSSPAVAAPTTLASNRTSVEATYDNEIARLRAVVGKRRSQLDSTTVAVLEHNLKVIDDAIAQCRQALRNDPGSRFLMESLNDALDTKVQLLRTAATLPSKA